MKSFFTKSSILLFFPFAFLLIFSNTQVNAVSTSTTTTFTQTPSAVITSKEARLDTRNNSQIASNYNLGNFKNLNSLATAIVNESKLYPPSISFTYSGNIEKFNKDFFPLLKKEFAKAGNDYIFGTLSKYALSTINNKGIIDFTYRGTSEQEKFVTKQVKKIASSLTKANMTDLEKINAVNSYVVTHTDYSLTAKSDPHHVYTYLTEGKAVCQAYALLTYRLLTEMGIEARYVVGNANTSTSQEDHAWNSVKLNGEWFHLDTTWNGEKNDLRYTYFLVSSDTLRKDHTWEEELYPKSTSNQYNYLNTIKMAFEYNGEIYYSDENDDSLNTVNLTTGNKKLLIKERSLYPVVYNNIIYYSNFSDGAYLHSYNIATDEKNTLLRSETLLLQLVDDKLSYVSKELNKSYELPQTTDPLVQKTKVAINDLTAARNSYLQDIQNALELYNALNTAQQSDVTNYTMLQSIAYDTADAQQTYSQINLLDGKLIQPLIDARKSYEKLTSTNKVLITNLAVLTNYEEPYKNVLAAIAAIEAIEPSSSKFIQQIAIARERYNNALAQQNLVLNATEFLSLEKQAKVFTQISSLKSTNKTYIADITAAKKAYDALGKNNAAVVNYPQLQTALTAIKPAQAVVKKINALKSTNKNYIQEVTKVKTQYNALKTNKKYVTNASKLTVAINSIKPAQAVVKKIANLNGSSKKNIRAARTSYNALNKKSKNHITNYKKLVTLEKKFK